MSLKGQDEPPIANEAVENNPVPQTKHPSVVSDNDTKTITC
jgi:hypothetical protein